MADKKISQLTNASTPLAGTEVLPIVQSGSTVKVSIANVTAGRSVATADVYAVTSGVLNQVDPVVTAQTGSTTYGGLYAVKDGSGDQRGFRQKVYKANVGLIDSVTYDSLGNVGINTTSPSTYGKHVVNNDNGSYAYVAVANDQSSARIRIKNTATGGGDYAFIAGENNVGQTGLTLFSVGGSTLWALDDGNGNIAQKIAAKGINFTANTPAAGMTSQLLNWYEEGTWTPVPTASTGTITSYTSSGRYTRIGRSVVLSFQITITNNGTGAGILFATGMPFAANAVNLESGTIAEVAIVGFSGYTVFNTTTKLSMGKYDNTYPGGTNYVIVGQITYQI